MEHFMDRHWPFFLTSTFSSVHSPCSSPFQPKYLNFFFSSLSHKSAILAASPVCVLTLQGNSFTHPARFELDGRQIVKFKAVLALFLRVGFSDFSVTLPSEQSSSKKKLRGVHCVRAPINASANGS